MYEIKHFSVTSKYWWYAQSKKNKINKEDLSSSSRTDKTNSKIRSEQWMLVQRVEGTRNGPQKKDIV